MKARRFKKLLTMLLAAAMVMTLFVPFAFAGDTARPDKAPATQESVLQSLDSGQLQQVQKLQQDVEQQESLSLFGTWVTVRILGYDEGGGVGRVILDDYKVRLTETTGYSVLDALEKVCADKNISYTIEDTIYGPYVSEIGGQVEKHFQSGAIDHYFAGWSYRVWPVEYRPEQPQEDTMPPVGAPDYALENGDMVTWYYTLPAETWYTIMDNYSDIDLLTWRGQTLDVNVKGQKYEDTENWSLLPFTNLAGATVTLTRACDGAELASAVSNASGNAALTVPAVGFPTLCYIGVKGKYYTTEPIVGATEHVASWEKPVIVIW